MTSGMTMPILLFEKGVIKGRRGKDGDEEDFCCREVRGNQ